MAAKSLKQAKSLLRKEIKLRISKLSDLEKASQSAVVVQKALSHDFYIKSQRISVFLSMSDEICTEVIVKDILKQKNLCFIPYYSGPEMRMLELKSWEDFEELPETKWKIKQPINKEDRLDALDSGGLDLVFVPGLAFTASGARLGRGKGYYDKFLHECQKHGPKPKTIALAFKEQICSEVPVSEDDFLIDEILYPS